MREREGSRNRIDTTLEDFIRLGLQSRKPANVACRCTVFTKSDMIHLQNKGEKLEDIIYGLHLGNARNYISTIVSTRVLEEPMVFVGGLSLNAFRCRPLKPTFRDSSSPLTARPQAPSAWPEGPRVKEKRPI
jgi:activator of 2-hydroxyglutaryl-CoA dehydratase